MSTTAHPPETAVFRDCDRDECDDEYREGAGHAGFCSDVCWARATSARLLDIVQHDHKFCASCFRQLREVIPPGRAPDSSDKHREIPDCAIGWSLARPGTTPVHGEAFRLTETERGFETRVAGSTRRQGCACGPTHHATVERTTLSTADAISHANRLADALAGLREDGVHDHAIDRDILLDTVRACKRQPDQQGDDGEIFQKAVAAALLAAHRHREP